MAFGDVFAGWQEAAHEHTQNLLQMDYENKRQLAQSYAKLAEDQSYPTEARTEFAKRAMQIPALEPGKKLPKEWESMTIKVSQPTPPPITAPGSAGTPGTSPEGVPQAATAAINPQTVQPPTPPPHDQSVFQPKTFAENLSQQQQTMSMQIDQRLKEAQASGDIQTEQQIKTDKRRFEVLKEQFPNLPESSVASLAFGHTPPSMSFSVPKSIDGTSAASLSPVDAGGKPIDITKHYAARMMNGQWVLTQASPELVGGVRFAQDDQGHWVGYTVEKELGSNGKPVIHVEQNLGLTPPQGVPTTSVSHDVRIVSTPDGGFEEVPITQTTTRSRPGASGVAAPPTPPAGKSAAPTAVPTTAPSAPVPPTPPKPSASSGAGGGTVKIPGAGRSLTPEQMQNNQAKGEAFTNMIDRMTNVLANADKMSSLAKRTKISLAVDPAHPGRTMIAGAVGLSPEEASFAGDYLSLGEDINLLRGVFQATGFRGPEAFATQQAQRGPLLGDTGLFKKVLSNSLKASVDQLSVINKQMTRAGQPMELTDGILKAFMLLNNNDEHKALAALKNAGWKVE